MNGEAPTRREVLASVGALASLTVAPKRRKERLFFTSLGKTAVINADGSGLHYFDFHVPNQTTWQPGPFLSDHRRVIFLSMEPRRDGPGKPFDIYYTQTPTHLWLYDLDRRSLTEIATRERIAVFETPALLVSDSRILVQVVRDRVGQIFSMNLDGTDAKPFTKAGEGLPYGLSLSPDGARVAFHISSPRGYEVYTSNVDGSDRILVAGKPGHLFFGTSWSPDGKWIVFQDCVPSESPGHDWSDIMIGRPDGSEIRALTTGASQWFAATYGPAEHHAGGSNMPSWTNDGAVLFSRRAPDSQSPWEFQPNRPDVDHFNRDYHPEHARGGAQICRVDPAGAITPLTEQRLNVWDMRASQSPTGAKIVFCRAKVGGFCEVWTMDPDGRNQRLLTRGLHDQGADQPRWLP